MGELRAETGREEIIAEAAERTESCIVRTGLKMQGREAERAWRAARKPQREAETKTEDVRAEWRTAEEHIQPEAAGMRTTVRSD